MRRKSFGKIFKHTTALVMAVAMLAGGAGGGSNPTVVHAAALSHEKATEADVVNGDRYNSKGVQGTEFADLENGDSVANLNLNHIMLNVDLADIIARTGEGTPYKYKGKTYYFNENEGSMMKVLLHDVKKYREEGITWTFCLVMNFGNKANNPASPWYNPELNKLMYNSDQTYYPEDASQEEPHNKVYYALNSTDSEAQEWISAILHYMAEKFSYSDTFVQNWRVGNEVNVSHDYNYTGAAESSMKDTLVGLATASYNLLYEALQKENPYARAYVSVTHDWNNSNEGKGVPTKDFLDAFDKGVNDKNWNLDFHAYPPQMKEQVWTKASAEYLTHRESTKFICGPNLEVLTNYIKDHFGTNHRIIMSEQSYDSAFGAEQQAAMIAQTYYAGVNNDMVDAIIFTTYRDTGSGFHDNYDMGIVYKNGNKKPSYQVFQYMNTDQAAAYTNPYLSKLSEWTGRTISSWADDILYKAPKTDAVLTEASLVIPSAEEYIEGRDPNKMVWMSMWSDLYGKDVDLEYYWEAYNTVTGKTLVIGDWISGNAAIEWIPEENAVYRITCTVRVAGNPSSSITKSADITVKMPGLPSSVQPGRTVPYYDKTKLGGDWDGTYYYLNGKKITDAWFFDGKYTYYLMMDGTPMKDRLTYHPDGKHVIYFDKDGHELFDDFANIRKNIEGKDVDDMCFFNSLGYMYVDTLTYDMTGTKLYYVNPYGVLEHNGWFTFSGKEFGAGLGFSGRAGGYGFANEDCSLWTNTSTYDWENRLVYIQGDGHMFLD